jgi:RNA polymerase sigma-70 factor, ECF subfamily
MKTDQELVEDCLAGDTEGFKSLVTRYEQRLIRFIRAKCYGVIEAEDIYQETMLNAYRYLGSYQAQFQFSTWLYKIALNQIADKVKKIQETSCILDHDIEVEDPDLSDNVWHLVRAKLSEQQFNLLWMMYVEGFSGSEIAKTLEKSLPWVKVNLFRTKQLLKTMLTEQGYTLADCS